MIAYAHPRCYARCLGNCSPELSREHYFSRGILEFIEAEGGLKSTGMPGLGAEPRRLPPNALAAKILCKHHNSALSELDEAGLRFFRLFRDHQRNIEEDGPLHTRHRTPGNPIELWMLKALCGFLAASGATTEAGDQVHMEPPAKWVRILFGVERMPRGWGMYSTGPKTGRRLTDGGSLFVGPRFAPKDRVSIDACIGARVEIHGIEFSLALVDPPPESVALQTWMSPAWYRITEIVFRNEETFREHTEEISWKPKERYAKSITVKRLPTSSAAS